MRKKYFKCSNFLQIAMILLLLSPDEVGGI